MQRSEAGFSASRARPMAAVTGFVSLVLVEDHNLPIEAGTRHAGVVVGLLSGLLVSIPLARLESHWVALATIALVLMARVVVLNLDSVTGGVDGAPITRLVEPWHLITALGAVMWVMARHSRSRLGLAAESIRSHPDVAASLAIDVSRYTRRSLWMLSGAIAGLAGVVYASLVQFLSPDTFYVNIAFVMLAAVVLGGNRHWFGGIVGAFVFTILPEILRRFLTQGETIVNGVLLILIMIYLPRGLVDPTRKVRRELKSQATNIHSESWRVVSGRRARRRVRAVECQPDRSHGARSRSDAGSADCPERRGSTQDIRRFGGDQRSHLHRSGRVRVRDRGAERGREIDFARSNGRGRRTGSRKHPDSRTGHDGMEAN